MKKILFSILSAFMVCTMASAQYLNVKMDDGTYRSFKTSSKTEVSFGAKKGTEPTEFEQILTIGDYKVTVKLAEDTPASDVALNAYIETGWIMMGKGTGVVITATSWSGKGLCCSRDDNGEDAYRAEVSDDGLFTFLYFGFSKDVVFTVGYINVSFDMNNSNITDNFTAKPADITKMKHNSPLPRTYAFAEKHGFRGWYKDKECTNAWNYSTDKVHKSITLYAKWAEDPTKNQINDHDFVKLGGYYWATENVGAAKDLKLNDLWTYGTNGLYYYNQANAKEAAKTWNPKDQWKPWEYGSDGGHPWISPSEDHWQTLIDCCDWKWQENYNGTNISGYLVEGRDDTYESGHSIFLRAAGVYDTAYNPAGRDQNIQGWYWSTDNKVCFVFGNGHQTLGIQNQTVNTPVRPVAE